MPLWFILTIAGLFSVALADISQKVTLKVSHHLVVLPIILSSGIQLALSHSYIFWS